MQKKGGKWREKSKKKTAIKKESDLNGEKKLFFYPVIILPENHITISQ